MTRSSACELVTDRPQTTDPVPSLCADMKFAAAVASGGLIGAILALVLTDRDPGHTPTVIATALVAVLVALITAVTTDRRQNTQLAHEQATLGSQFAHERIMHDLEELRTITDDALAAATRLADVPYWHVARALRDPPVPDSDEVVDQWMTLYFEADRQGERLRVRLKDDHSVVQTYFAALEVLRQAVNEIAGMSRAGRTDHDSIMGTADQGADDFESRIKEFVAEANALIGIAHELAKPAAEQ